MSAVSREHLRDLDRAIERAVRPAGIICALGGDPGGTLGLFLGFWSRPGGKLTDCRAWQCGANGAPELLSWVLDDWGHVIGAAGLEDFRSGPKSVKLRGTSSGAVRAQLSDMEELIYKAGIPVAVRPAATVKTWATDDRLARAGLIAATSGMPKHARDAARQALFCACADLGLRDPLSRRTGGEP